MVTGTFTILNSSGFHARPAGLFVKTASASVPVSRLSAEADGEWQEHLSLMLLGATPGAEITIEARAKTKLKR